MTRAALGVVATSLWMASASSLARADDANTPKSYELVYDAYTVKPSALNFKLQSTDLYEGDTLTITVDPTQIFFASWASATYSLVPLDAVPPELRHFYVGATNDREVSYRVGTCKPRPSDATKLDFIPAPHQELYPFMKCRNATGLGTFPAKERTTIPMICDDPNSNKAMRDLVPVQANPVTNPPYNWQLVGMINGDGPPEVAGADNNLICLTDDNTGVVHKQEQFALGKAVNAVTVNVVSNSGAPLNLAATQIDDGRWQAAIPLKAGTFFVTVTVKRDDPTAVPRIVQIPAFVVGTPDAHSLVRIQVEALITNRFRSASFAVGVAPVRRDFFVKGPWKCGWNILLCGISPVALIRLSGDANVAQLGGGIAVFFTKAFQLNAGFLVGTHDISTGWHWEDNWFLGLAVDPALLTEIQNTQPKSK